MNHGTLKSNAHLPPRSRRPWAKFSTPSILMVPHRCSRSKARPTR